MLTNDNSPSILFLSPDYHNTFSIANELIKRGWRTKIWVPIDYPSNLLFSNSGVTQLKLPFNKESKINRYLSVTFQNFWYLLNFWKFDYHVYYGRILKFPFMEKSLKLNRIFGDSFSIALHLARLLRKKIVYIPSGCHDEMTKENFGKISNGIVCKNCGFESKCSDVLNIRNLKTVRRYSSLNIGFGYLETAEYPQNHLKWKIVTDDFVKSAKRNFHVPETPHKKGLLIYHGFVPSGRDADGKNIKGTPQIIEAINRLQNEGHDIELVNVTDKNSNEVRFIQAKCDVILDQLIYGWWGSTGVEGMALGKPVICYLRAEWKQNFLENYHEYQDLPVIEANAENIYDVLLSILKDRSILERASEKSIDFSRKHFDPKTNVDEFVQAIISL